MQSFFDNINAKVVDDLKVSIKKGTKLSIASACFSIYAFEELKSQLQDIEELRFIFTAPSFLKDGESKQRREFYIPRIDRERALYGSQFEVKLRNQLTQKAIAIECADWIREKVKFKSNITSANMLGFINIENDEPATGSATTAHAVMQLNAEDNGNRKFILVQLPEETEQSSEAYKAGYKNICEIGKERIRRAGKKIKEEMEEEKAGGDWFARGKEEKPIDTGFRVLKLDTSNMQDVYYRPEDSSDATLFEDNVKPDRTAEDLLFQVMLECNLPLSAKIEKKTISGKEVFNVNDGYLLACFDEDVNETVITEVAKQKPYYFIMRDKSLSSDNVADNFEQIFNAYSKDTIRKIL